MEGAWMLKHNGKYYLTYSAAGTEHRTYAMGCYAAESPLGPFTPQKHNPIFAPPPASDWHRARQHRRRSGEPPLGVLRVAPGWPSL